MGTLAALVGSALVGGMAAWVTGMGWAPALDASPWKALVAIAVGGVVGSLVDSLLGATLQAIYFCPAVKRDGKAPAAHLWKNRASARAGVVEQ